MASTGQFPPLLGRRFRDRAPAGLLVTALAAVVLAVGFDLTSIASLGSAVALVVFTLVTAGHLRVHKETGARPWLLVVAIVSTVVVLATFAVTTLVDEPGTAVALVAILLLSILLDLGWKRSRDAQHRRAVSVPCRRPDVLPRAGWCGPPPMRRPTGEPVGHRLHGRFIVTAVWEYTVWDAFWTMLWFFLFFIWIWLLIAVFSDIFRSDDLSGWSKALWTIFVIVLPYLGVFVYLIARGKKMGEHHVQDASRREEQMRSYVQEVAGSGKSTGSRDRDAGPAAAAGRDHR